MDAKKTKDEEIALPECCDVVAALGLTQVQNESVLGLRYLAESGVLWLRWGDKPWQISKRRKAGKRLDLGLLVNAMVRGDLYYEINGKG